MVETSQCRSRESSQRTAMAALVNRLTNVSRAEQHSTRAFTRKQQMGTGMRGDKVRTYRFQDDIATNHTNNKKANLSKVMGGYFELLWDN